MKILKYVLKFFNPCGGKIKINEEWIKLKNKIDN